MAQLALRLIHNPSWAPLIMIKKLMLTVAWPSFLAASALEMFVFVLFDPSDGNWLGKSIELSRQGVYTISFFVFWLIALISGSLSVYLLESNAD